MALQRVADKGGEPQAQESCCDNEAHRGHARRISHDHEAQYRSDRQKQSGHTDSPPRDATWPVWPPLSSVKPPLQAHPKKRTCTLLLML